MKTIKSIILFFFISINLIAQSDSLSISGELEGFDQDDLITLWITKGNINQKVGQFEINNNLLNLKYKLTETPNRIKLTASNTRKRLVLWVNNEDIKIIGNKERFDESQIIGSEYLKGENDFRNIYNRDSSLHFRIKCIEDFINTPSAVYRLSRLFREIESDKLEQLYQQLDPIWKDHDFGILIHNYLTINQRNQLKVNDDFIDFVAKDNNEEEFSFSNYIKNDKITLLEFSSYACQWCRKAFPVIKQINQEYSDHIQIVTFIQDTREEIRDKYLQKFQSDWKQIWDGKGEIGKTFLKYGINGSPTYFLISSKGKILDKWTGFENKESIINRLEKAKLRK